MRFAVLVFTLLATFSCVEAQSLEPRYEVVLPGSDVLDTGRIRPHQVRYEKPGGFMRYDFQRIERGGRDLYRLHVYFNTEDGPPDEMYFDPQTLAFVGRRLETSDYVVVDVQFADGRFAGELVPKEGSTLSPSTYDKTYPHAALEPAVINYWITALPLAEGYRASIPVFNLSGGSSMTWANIEVLARETLDIGGKRWETWKVQSTNGKRRKTLWVSPSVPFALKMVTKGSFGVWVVEDFGLGAPATSATSSPPARDAWASR